MGGEVSAAALGSNPPSYGCRIILLARCWLPGTIGPVTGVTPRKVPKRWKSDPMKARSPIFVSARLRLLVLCMITCGTRDY